MVGPVWPDLGPFGMRFWPCGPGGGGRRGAGAAFGEVAWPCCEGGGGTRLIPALPPPEDAPTTPEDPLFRGLAGMFFLKEKWDTVVTGAFFGRFSTTITNSSCRNLEFSQNSLSFSENS